MTFSFKQRAVSFKYAFSGILTVIKTQHNAWIHLVATLGVTIAGFYFQLSVSKWCVLIIAIIMVWLAETLNTAIEFLADTITTDHHPLIGKAKDVAAGAVLVTAIGASIIGLLIFGPYLTNLLNT